jgi:hypothetical protein
MSKHPLAFVALLVLYFAVQKFDNSTSNYLIWTIATVAIGAAAAHSAAVALQAPMRARTRLSRAQRYLPSFMPIAWTCGALAAVADQSLSSALPWAAAVPLSLLMSADRLRYLPNIKWKAVHLVLAIGGGALAQQALLHTVNMPHGFMLLGYCVAAALIALPLALDHDDPLAIRLEAAAATLPVGPRSELLSSAQLRRATLTSTLTRDSQASVAMAFETLLRLAQSRSELAALDANAINPVAVAIDKKIAFAVHTLRRAFAASDSLAAMADTADATAIGQLDAVSSSLEALREELS